MAKSAPHGGRRLSDLARHVVLPEGIASTDFPLMQRHLTKMGLSFDPWQAGMATAILAKREDGKYAAGIGGVVASIPRQSGKTYLMGALTFALALEHPGFLALWSAHRSRAHNETFKSMVALSERPEVKPFAKRALTGAGTEAIEFNNGSRILFGAREHGFGRGFAKVDLLVLDEAQILTASAMEDMVPATNAAPNGLVMLMGTPPRPGDPGAVFLDRRAAALSGEDKDVLYVEFSADQNADPDDRKQWAKANPSYPHRTSDTSMLRMKKLLGSPESFAREAMGVWDVKAVQPTALNASDWSARAVESGPASGVTCFAVKFSADGAEVALGAARREGPGAPVHVEGIRSEPMAAGTDWLVDWLTERADRAAQIVIDGKSSAAYLSQALIDAGVPKRAILTPTLPDVLAAHSMFAASVKNVDEMTHSDQELLTQQALWARKREIGKDGGFGWKAPEGESVTLLEACTFAFWAARTTKRRPGRRARLV